MLMVKQGKVSPILRLRNNVIARAELIGKIGQPVSPLVNALLAYPPARSIAEKLVGVAREAPLPPISREKFSTWYKKRSPNIARSRKIVYFHGCSTQYYEPRIGKAAIQVLETNGFEVIVPEQNCCGLPLLSNGEFKAAKKYHQNNVRSLVKYARQGIPIVGTSTSCTLTIKEEAPELLNLHDDDTRIVAHQTFDFNEFLLDLHEAGELNLDFKSLPMKLAYHIPCQYRAHRLGRPGMEVLGLIPDLAIIDSNADCCGIAGTYGYKKEKYSIAMEIGKPLFQFVDEVNGPVVICDSETCRWQITHATGSPAVHPCELLAMAYGFEPEGPLTQISIWEG
jgi:glycerol-3-phosphate dehydrogenase subunit C